MTATESTQVVQLMQTIIIYNPCAYHYECIESVIHYLPKILCHKLLPKPNIILNINTTDIRFIKYIDTYTQKIIDEYVLSCIAIINAKEQIVLPSTPTDVRIVLTIPQEDENIAMCAEIYNMPQTYWISHHYNLLYPKLSNIFYLAPHCDLPNQYFIPTILPFSHESVSFRTITPEVCENPGLNLLVQGSLWRRNKAELFMLINLVKLANEKMKDTSPNISPIKLYILTRKILPNIPIHPCIILKTQSDFWEFNQLASQADIIFTLTSNKTHPEYYNRSLTSSISYGLGYRMHIVIDKNLAAIYNSDLSCSPSTVTTYSSLHEFKTQVIQIFTKYIANLNKNHE